MGEKDNIDVEKVAMLARLELGGEEAGSLRDDMRRIVSYIGMLSELSLQNVEPTAHVMPLNNVSREDVAEDSFPRAEMLANSPDTVDDELVKVHQVVDSH